MKNKRVAVKQKEEKNKHDKKKSATNKKSPGTAPQQVGAPKIPQQVGAPSGAPKIPQQVGAPSNERQTGLPPKRLAGLRKGPTPSLRRWQVKYKA